MTLPLVTFSDSVLPPHQQTACHYGSDKIPFRRAKLLLQTFWSKFNRISEPLAFEQPAFTRGWTLLELACRGVTGHGASPAFQNLFGESAFPERLALLTEIMPGIADLWSAVGAFTRISFAGNRPFRVQKYNMDGHPRIQRAGRRVSR